MGEEPKGSVLRGPCADPHTGSQHEGVARV